MAAKLISIDSFPDSRGSLIVGEFPKTLPFDPVRFFVVSDTPAGGSRGNHAHRTNEQVLFCLTGTVHVKVYDSNEWEEFTLTPGTQGLYLPALHWGEQVYLSSDTTLLVLASETFSAEGYIESLEELDSYAANRNS
jgi:UDP-2-acetamido-3-amino-2,3-dideoxy-glucuronate N-acetyltransferase